MSFDDIALILTQDLAALKCGTVCREFRFDSRRKWRFDFALPQIKCAVEVDGGAWTQGRHTRGKGFIGDLEKLNNATAQGWRVFRFTLEQVRDGSAMAFLRRAIR